MSLSSFARRNWLATTTLYPATAMAGLFLPHGAVAAQVAPPPPATEASTQDAGDTDSTGDDIVVTGIRAGLARAIDAKRTSNEIVEVVSAEDIGKLPGISIAESLARLPGVAAQRVDGRAQVLSINLSNDPARRYKEVFISLGGVQSAVYATEVSDEEYLVRP